MNFQLLALDARQQVVALALQAANEAAAADEARRQGLTVISLEAKGLRFALSRGKRFPTTLFSVELLSLPLYLAGQVVRLLADAFPPAGNAAPN